MTDYNNYYIVDDTTESKVRGALLLAKAMANKSYPHLVEEIQSAIDMQTEKTEYFVGTQNKPQTKPAYKQQK